jgi:uncharacterized protein (TIGR02246 family)
MRKSLATVCLALLLGGVCVAQGGGERAGDEAAIRAVVQGLADFWTAGDGRGFAKAFAEDADFTVWNGLYVKGREAIARGHEQIFSTIYKGTKLRLDVRSVRFLSADVAVVHAAGQVVKKEEAFKETPEVVPVFVFKRGGGGWQIAVFQNTQLLPGEQIPHSRRP